MKLTGLDKFFLWLSVAGALNWGTDLLGSNLVDSIFGSIADGAVAKLIYAAVGVSAFYIGYRLIKNFK